MGEEKITAIVLAGGSGKRMGAALKKQYLSLAGRPVLYYSLKAFQDSRADKIILVSNEKEYCMKEIVQKYGLDKVAEIVPGGAERVDSSYAGLRAAEGSDYVLIHDGARPFLTGEVIDASICAAKEHGACAVGMPVKDTVKLADADGFAEKTPDRGRTWQIQTPQAFSYPLILKAYEKVIKERPHGITDDASAVEYGHFAKVKLIFGSYGNIKITTPEDMVVAEALYRHILSEF